MFDIVSLGELLIDFTESGVSPAGQRLFEQNAGGAVANLVAAASQCGTKTALLAKVGADMHGRFLKQALVGAGVDTSGVIESEDVFTTLAFVALAANGERTFSFARKPGADTCYRADELPRELLQNTKIFHTGSLSLTAEPVVRPPMKPSTLPAKQGSNHLRPQLPRVALERQGRGGAVYAIADRDCGYYEVSDEELRY